MSRTMKNARCNPVRLYRFYNTMVSQRGEPFGMCDKHRLSYELPKSCIMERLADKSKLVCEQCEEEKS